MLNSVQFSQLIYRFASVLIAVSQSRKGKNKGNLWVNIERKTIKKPENSSPSVPEIMKARLKPELALTEIRSQRNLCLYEVFVYLPCPLRKVPYCRHLSN